MMFWSSPVFRCVVFVLGLQTFQKLVTLKHHSQNVVTLKEKIETFGNTEQVFSSTPATTDLRKDEAESVSCSHDCENPQHLVISAHAHVPTDIHISEEEEEGEEAESFSRGHCVILLVTGVFLFLACRVLRFKKQQNPEVTVAKESSAEVHKTGGNMSRNPASAHPISIDEEKYGERKELTDKVTENTSPETKDPMEFLSERCRQVLEHHFNSELSTIKEEMESVKDTEQESHGDDIWKGDTGEDNVSVSSSFARDEKEPSESQQLLVPYALTAEAERKVDWIWGNPQLNDEDVSESFSSEVIWPPTPSFNKENVHALCEKCKETLNREVCEWESVFGWGDTSLQNTKELILYAMGWEEPESVDKRKAFDLLLSERRMKAGEWKRCLLCKGEWGEKGNDFQSPLRISSDAVNSVTAADSHCGHSDSQ